MTPMSSGRSCSTPARLSSRTSTARISCPPWIRADIHASNESRSCAGFDVAVVTVPTPLTEGRPDLSFIEGASRTLARYVRPGALVVLESTTYPGTTEEFVVPMLEEGSGLIAGEDFFVGYSPERIDPGNRVWTLTNTPKVVSGINEASLERVDRFYRTLVNHTVPVSGTHEAELTKLLENTFRHVNIALVNELAVFAAELGIDVWEAIGAAASKPFGFMPFHPGPGVGGHCLPIDPELLVVASSDGGSGSPSASSSWPTTSTSTCPTMSFDA